jgi:subtilisin family serine protease
MTGTSQATAFVSGLAALLLSKDSTLKPQQLREIIMASVDRLPQLDGKVAASGRINAYSALLALKTKGQSGKTNFIAQSPTSLLDHLVTPSVPTSP